MDDILKEAMRIVDEARRRKITLRLLGAAAVRLHCQRFSHLLDQLQRFLTDVDVVTYRAQAKPLSEMLKELGYTPMEKMDLLYLQNREIFHIPEKKLTVDVFFDALEMCHRLDFRGRLELDYPTITLADVLLEKMQIVQINKKDIQDTIIMLREHEVGEIEKETVNAKHISRLLSNDWGFYYTVTTNLRKARDFLPEFRALSEIDQGDVSCRIDKLLAYIDKEPKSFYWKMRARLGPSKKWYREVEEVERVG